MIIDPDLHARVKARRREAYVAFIAPLYFWALVGFMLSSPWAAVMAVVAVIYTYRWWRIHGLAFEAYALWKRMNRQANRDMRRYK